MDSIRCSVSTVGLLSALASSTVTRITFSACRVSGRLLILRDILTGLIFDSQFHLFSQFIKINVQRL